MTFLRFLPDPDIRRGSSEEEVGAEGKPRGVEHRAAVPGPERILPRLQL